MPPDRIGEYYCILVDKGGGTDLSQEPIDRVARRHLSNPLFDAIRREQTKSSRNSDSTPVSNRRDSWIYVNGQVLTSEELKKYKPVPGHQTKGDEEILWKLPQWAENLSKSGQLAVRCRSGNFHAYKPGHDSLLELKPDPIEELKQLDLLYGHASGRLSTALMHSILGDEYDCDHARQLFDGIRSLSEAAKQALVIEFHTAFEDTGDIVSAELLGTSLKGTKPQRL